MRTGRSIRGYSLPPHCNRAERRDVEEILVNALNKLGGEYAGTVLAREHVPYSPEQAPPVKASINSVQMLAIT